MSKKKKSGNKNETLTKFIILVTALLNLIKAVLDLIERLLE